MEANWHAIHRKLQQPAFTKVSFDHVKTGMIAATLFIALNVGSWIWALRSPQVDTHAPKQENYMQAYSFSLY